MHGALVRALVIEGSVHDIIQHPIEFVINGAPRVGGSSAVVETIATNLHITGFHLETKSPTYAKLYGICAVGSEVPMRVSIILRDALPFSFFTSDSMIVDSRGMTLSHLSSKADNLNATKGLGLLERLFELQERYVVMNTVMVPFNHFKAHKEHNVTVLSNINNVIGAQFRIKGANICIKLLDEECSICMEGGKVGSALQCNHVFCLGCIEEILRVETCPRCSLCRAEFAFNNNVGVS